MNGPTTRPLKIYFAGDLFDAKDLGGNLLLAAAIEKCSDGKYSPQLPQDGESEVRERTSQSIRDEDFKLLLNCDIIVANFDGPDPDSGTVVEFCFAKMVDMPAVLLRTDFRDSGDAALPDGCPWNLMCSHFPRTGVLHINSMERYHRFLNKNDSVHDRLEKFYNSIAEEIIGELDKVIVQKSWLKSDEVLSQYRNAVKSMGGGMSEHFPEAHLTGLVNSKIEMKLYQ